MSWMKSSVVVALLSAFVTGCDNSEPATPAPSNEVTKKSDSGTEPKSQPIIPVTQMKDWCPEHGVPESICVQCNSSLAADFKAKGDWDEAHNLPKSQCFKCDPTLKEKFALAYKEKYGTEAPSGEDGH